MSLASRVTDLATAVATQIKIERARSDVRYALKGNPADTGYDVVLLLGQSNMEGTSASSTSAISPVLDVTDSRIYSYASSGTYAGQIAQASDPLGHPGYLQATIVVGPGMSFARWYLGMIPGNRRVLLVPAAYGGTAFGSGSPRWDPTTNWPPDNTNLYNLAINQVSAAVAAAGANARIVAALWIQGESDAVVSLPAATYRTYFEQLIDGLRSRLSLPNLPFVIGSMTPEFLSSNGAAAVAIDGVHQGTPGRKAYTAFVPGPAGLGRGDNLHYNPAGAREMGRRLVAGLFTAMVNTTPVTPIAAAPPAPPVAPSTPTIGTATATAAPGSASVTFTPGSGAGSQFTVTSTTGVSATGTSSPITLSGLSSTPMTFTVTASNLVGSSAPSAASNSITPSPAYTITSAFNQADGAVTTADTGQTLTSLNGQWRTLSNQAAPPSTLSGSTLLVGDLAAANHSAQAAFMAGIGSNGVAVRVSDASNYYVAASGGSGYQIYKVVGGTVSSIGPVGGSSPVVGDVVKLSASGNTLSLSVNGTQVIAPFTDTTFPSATKAGIWANGVNARIDNMTLASPPA